MIRRYLIVAPSQVRPGQVYRVAVDLLESPFPLTMTASIQCNGEEIAGTTERLITGESQTLLMKVCINSFIIHSNKQLIHEKHFI